jgi:hypothetical protein
MSDENVSPGLFGSSSRVTYAVLAFAAALLGGLGSLAWYKPDNLALPSFLILISLGVFVLLMIYAANSLKSTGVFDLQQPFGMPPGTIRAILTLAFIILIGVFGSLVLLRSEGRSPLSPLPGLQALVMKPAEVDQLRRSLGDDVVVVATESGTGTVTVSAFVKRDYRAADSIAQNIISMLSTLLAAMIGFYFGARIDGGGGETGAKPEPESVALQGQMEASTRILAHSRTAHANLLATDKTKLDETAKKKLDVDTKAIAAHIKVLEAELAEAKLTLDSKSASPQLRKQQTEKLASATAKVQQ